MQQYVNGAAIKAQVFVLAGTLFWMTPLQAQLPDAGSTLRELQVPELTFPEEGGPVLRLPELPARDALPSDIQVQVQEFRVDGNTLLSSEQLLDLLRDLQDRELTLEQLYSAADRLTLAYQSRGYLLSRAFLPAQEITGDGIVLVSVLEGRYGEVRTENTSLLSDRAVAAYLVPARSGDIVNVLPLERQLLLLDDLPGIIVQTELGAGAATGETDLLVRAAREPRTTGSLRLDNQGSKSTGEYRLNGSVSVASPLKRGDRFNLSVLGSEEDQLFYQARYETPLNASGTSMSVNASRMAYQLAGDFAALNADGEAQAAGLTLRHAWRRSRTVNLYSDVGYEYRDLQDSLGGGAIETSKSASNYNIGLNGDWRDNFGAGAISVFSLRWVRGSLDLKQGVFPAETPRGDFDKWQLSLIRLQGINGRLSLYTAVQLQTSGDNLDSSEKMVLGGAQGVRGYPLGEASSDEAALANIELRYRVNDDWQIRLLADGGYARLLKRPQTADNNTRTLSSAGLAVDWQAPFGLQLSLTAASRTGDAALSEAGSTRVWGSIFLAF